MSLSNGVQMNTRFCVPTHTNSFIRLNLVSRVTQELDDR
jgi:hypothetical protein